MASILLTQFGSMYPIDNKYDVLDSLLPFIRDYD